MRNRAAILAVVVAGFGPVLAGAPAAAALALAAGRGAAVVSGAWGTAHQVPGLARLNAGGSGGVLSVSCASAGSCSAGGSYLDSASHRQAFVLTQFNGTWGKAKEVPGTATLNAGGGAAVTSVSCASAGNCSADGSYGDGTGSFQVFVVSQANGTWGRAKEVPGTATLNAGGSAAVSPVSCASAGNCSAGGHYNDMGGSNQAFVVTQVNGIWSRAKEVPGTGTLNTEGDATVNSVSCATAGNCSAAGYYHDSFGQQAFLVSQANGTWAKAKEVPGTASLNTGGDATVNSVSCATAGNCSAGGFYTDGAIPSGLFQAFVVTRANGTWGTAQEVPGTASLNAGGQAAVNSVSCAAANRCSAGGRYLDSAQNFQAFVVTER